MQGGFFYEGEGGLVLLSRLGANASHTCKWANKDGKFVYIKYHLLARHGQKQFSHGIYCTSKLISRNNSCISQNRISVREKEPCSDDNHATCPAGLD